MLVDVKKELERFEVKLHNLNELDAMIGDFTAKDRSFASSLAEQFVTNGTLSKSQWDWVEKLVDRVRKAEPIYGDFKAIHVMFRLAGEHLKFPKIRLLSEQGTYVQLNFKPDTQEIDVYRDGWQGHGKRKFIGWLKEDTIVPHNDGMDEDVRLTIQSLSLDPAAVAKAMANKLGVCMYCGKRLSDAHSKEMGYGKICAAHYGLEY